MRIIIISSFFARLNLKKLRFFLLYVGLSSCSWMEETLQQTSMETPFPTISQCRIHLECVTPEVKNIFRYLTQSKGVVLRYVENLNGETVTISYNHLINIKKAVIPLTILARLSGEKIQVCKI